MRDVSCGVCACTPSTRSQQRAGGGTLSLASLAVLALAPHSAVGADGGAPARSTQMLRTRLCAQMEAPPQSLQMFFTRLCSQMEAPPQSTQMLHCRMILCRLCWQAEVPLTRLYSQMEAPPQSLQTPLCRLCSQMEVPPKSLHLPRAHARRASDHSCELGATSLRSSL